MDTDTTPTPTVTFAGVEYHLPFADLVRPHTEREREALAASIAETGVLIPIVTYDRLADAGGGVGVIDGATRLTIAAELELAQVPVEHLGALNENVARAFASSINTDRRHLNVSEQTATRKARIAAAVQLKDAGLSTRQIAKGLGISQARVRQDLAAGASAGASDNGEQGGAHPGQPSELDQAIRLLHNVLAGTRRLQKGLDQLSHTPLAQHLTRLFANHNAECALESMTAALSDLAAAAASGLDEPEEE